MDFSTKKESKIIRSPLPNKPIDEIIDSFENPTFCDFDKLNSSELDQMGFYIIKIKNGSKLPERYQRIINKRNSKLIYLGKAESQSLRERLNQEVYHTNPGTFFRSIGAVLGYTPISGHLKDKINQKNYKFSKTDTQGITKWLLANVEFSIHPIRDYFSIEKKLIEKHCPLLNYTHTILKD